jgi:TPR repeat protein
MKRIHYLLALSFVLSSSGCLVSPPVMIAVDVLAAAVKAGADYAEKNKPTPEERWEQSKLDRLTRRANDGDLDAQYELGLIHQAASSGKAKMWVCRAANNGLARAQTHMGHWYNEDRKQEDLWPFIDIRPDNREAFVWYSLAEANGNIFAGNFRNNLESESMSSDEIAKARNLLSRWKPAYCGFFASTSRPSADGVAAR